MIKFCFDDLYDQAIHDMIEPHFFGIEKLIALSVSELIGVRNNEILCEGKPSALLDISIINPEKTDGIHYIVRISLESVLKPIGEPFNNFPIEVKIQKTATQVIPKRIKKLVLDMIQYNRVVSVKEFYPNSSSSSEIDRKDVQIHIELEEGVIIKLPENDFSYDCIAQEANDKSYFKYFGLINALKKRGYDPDGYTDNVRGFVNNRELVDYLLSEYRKLSQGVKIEELDITAADIEYINKVLENFIKWERSNVNKYTEKNDQYYDGKSKFGPLIIVDSKHK